MIDLFRSLVRSVWSVNHRPPIDRSAPIAATSRSFLAKRSLFMALCVPSCGAAPPHAPSSQSILSSLRSASLHAALPLAALPLAAAHQGSNALTAALLRQRCVCVSMGCSPQRESASDAMAVLSGINNDAQFGHCYSQNVGVFMSKRVLFLGVYAY